MCKALTGQELKIIKRFKDNNPHICYYCNKAIIRAEELTVDHLQPLSRGGKTVDENMKISCKSCNGEKGEMTEQEYKIYKRNLHKNEIPVNIDSVVGEMMNIITLYNTLETQLKNTNEQINAIQNIMSNVEKVGTVGGYKYFEILQKLLKEKTTIEDQQKNLQPLYNCLINQKNALNNVKKNINQNIKTSEKSKVISLTEATEVIKKIQGHESLKLNIL